MSEKKYTAREAALAVLAKAAEVAKKHEHIGWGKLHGKLEREGYSDESADKIAGSVKAKLQKEEGNADEVAGAQGNSMPSENPMDMSEKNAEPKMKGHIKLAKFMGRMEHKRGKPAQELDKGETGHEKGVASAGSMPQTLGEKKQASVGRMMEQSQIKPKLPS